MRTKAPPERGASRRCSSVTGTSTPSRAGASTMLTACCGHPAGLEAAARLSGRASAARESATSHSSTCRADWSRSRAPLPSGPGCRSAIRPGRGSRTGTVSRPSFARRQRLLVAPSRRPNQTPSLATASPESTPPWGGLSPSSTSSGRAPGSSSAMRTSRCRGPSATTAHRRPSRAPKPRNTVSVRRTSRKRESFPPPARAAHRARPAGRRNRTSHQRPSAETVGYGVSSGATSSFSEVPKTATSATGGVPMRCRKRWPWNSRSPSEVSAVRRGLRTHSRCCASLHATWNPWASAHRGGASTSGSQRPVTRSTIRIRGDACPRSTKPTAACLPSGEMRVDARMTLAPTSTDVDCGSCSRRIVPALSRAISRPRSSVQSNTSVRPARRSMTSSSSATPVAQSSWTRARSLDLPGSALSVARAYASSASIHGSSEGPAVSIQRNSSAMDTPCALSS